MIPHDFITKKVPIINQRKYDYCNCYIHKFLIKYYLPIKLNHHIINKTNLCIITITLILLAGNFIKGLHKERYFYFRSVKNNQFTCTIYLEAIIVFVIYREMVLNEAKSITVNCLLRYIFMPLFHCLLLCTVYLEAIIVLAIYREMVLNAGQVKNC